MDWPCARAAAKKRNEQGRKEDMRMRGFTEVDGDAQKGAAKAVAGWARVRGIEARRYGRVDA